jgi:3-phenylpropionate/trans-cinnamate dioxygenase ferredoxin subunit
MHMMFAGWINRRFESVRRGYTLAEVPDGELRAFETPGGRVAVAHSENRLFALGDACTHAGCSLADGTLDDGAETVECVTDGSVFDLETGEPTEGPAADPVPVYPVREVEGWIEVLPHPSGDGSP